MPILFASTLLISSSLLFLVQPMAAKMLLPILGGSPNVWNTCMVFFQAGLLAGYASAHFLPRWLGLRVHVAVHLIGLVAAFFFLPLTIGQDIDPPTSPAWWLLGTLLVTTGWPYVFVATSGPLFQKWFAHASGGRDPYYLYAASNLGSFAALIAYPFLVEPHWDLDEQALYWTWGFSALVAFTALCAATLFHQSAAPARVNNVDPLLALRAGESKPSSWQRLRWVFLALVPSSLMLSVTNYLSTDIASMPFLWVIPIALYLLTFSIVFSSRPILPHRFMVHWFPAVVLILLVVWLSEATHPLTLILGLHLVGFFWLAMVCHGELSRTRPGIAHLTEFYLWLAVGGVLGGLFNALLAPLVFSTYVEYPLMIVAACLLCPSEGTLRNQQQSGSPPINRWDLLVPMGVGLLTVALALGWQASDLASQLLVIPSMFGRPEFDLPWQRLAVPAIFGLPMLIAFFSLSRAVRFGLTIGAIFLASNFYQGVHGASAFRLRSFFGVHRVTEKDGFRRIVHGSTVHGEQKIGDDSNPEPLAYFTREGPLGKLFKTLEHDPRSHRVGIIGLGAGAMACYAQPGQHWTFYEIDPAVIHLARDSGMFTFLQAAERRGSPIGIEPGDARLTLQKSHDKFGLLIMDAFGSDSIPMHLVTREALQLYLSRLDANGLIVFNVSNRNLDLEPLLANMAQDAGLIAWIAHDTRKDESAEQRGKSPSIWVVMARRREDFTREHGLTWTWREAWPNPQVRIWTDSFSNLFQVFRWRGE